MIPLLLLLLLFSYLSAQTGSTGIPPNEAKTLGTYVPEDITLVDAQGKEFKLGDLKGKPIIISPIYTTCKSACPLITKSLKEVIPKVGKPGEDFWVLTFTFDPKDTLENIKEYQERYRIDGKGWKVVMGKTKEDLFRLIDAIDFRFMTVENEYIHPNLVVVLSPELQIKDYLYGVSYDRLELINALRLARGEIALPEGFRSYLFIIGMVGFVGTSVYLLYLINRILQKRKKLA
ncbi:MAG: SCO family protein [Aquificae bacterium]|nr:SCO family protein [Aquificota bacterium]